MESNKNTYDDLTVIAGIGPARQRWLRESFNVHTYQDLAQLSVDRIESQLKADGQIASRDAIEHWLLETRELATIAARSSTPDLESAAKIAANKENSPNREDGWKPFASFVVEFQAREVEGQAAERRTAVHHMEEDTGTYWSGIESRQLCQWMLDQVRDKVGLEPEEYDLDQARPVEAPPAKKPSAEIQISAIRVFQPPDALTPVAVLEASEPFQGTVRGSVPFAIEVSFGLTGATAADVVAQGASCLVRSYAYEQAAGAAVHLGDAEPTALEADKYAYTLTLPAASLQSGTYRVWVIVGVKDAPAAPDYVEVPMLQVA